MFFALSTCETEKVFDKIGHICKTVSTSVSILIKIYPTSLNRHIFKTFELRSIFKTRFAII